MTPEEITKLARSLCATSNPTQDDVWLIEDIVEGILCTHCIVSKEKARAMMSELDEDIRTADTLKFADTPVAQLQKGRMQGHSIGAKSALLNIFGCRNIQKQ